MKENVIITLIVSCIAIVFMFTTISTSIKEKNLYPLTTVVCDISEATDTVTVKDYNGNLWQFKGVEDWNLNDICSCLMTSKGTMLIKDDEIVKIRYNGWFEGWKK